MIHVCVFVCGYCTVARVEAGVVLSCVFYGVVVVLLVSGRVLRGKTCGKGFIPLLAHMVVDAQRVCAPAIGDEGRGVGCRKEGEWKGFQFPTT